MAVFFSTRLSNEYHAVLSCGSAFGSHRGKYEIEWNGEEGRAQWSREVTTGAEGIKHLLSLHVSIVESITSLKELSIKISLQSF